MITGLPDLSLAAVFARRSIRVGLPRRRHPSSLPSLPSSSTSSSSFLIVLEGLAFPFLSPMDLETENRLAALLMDEARRLRAEADKEGVLAYLRKPKVRGRPNSRFLTATVLGVQQANKAVEVDELWRVREKELNLEKRLQHKSKGEANYRGTKHSDSGRSHSAKHEKAGSSSLPSSSKCGYEDLDSDEDGGFQDEEIEKFLNSRVKRGRGAVGSRMDEPGPYPSHALCDHEEDAPDVRTHEEWERRVLWPEKPSPLVSQNFIESPSIKKKVKSSSSSNHHKNEKHRKEKRSKKSRKEKISKHRH